jgi:hypothetical protein
LDQLHEPIEIFNLNTPKMEEPKINVSTSILRLTLILALLLGITQQTVLSQQLTGELQKTYVVKLRDGGSITGVLVSETASQIVLESASAGTVTLNKSQIASMTLLSAGDATKGWYPNPNPTKYLIGSSAIPLNRGEGYYQNTWLFFNSVNYAFTDYFSLAGGMEIFSIFGGSEGPYAFYLNPKVSFQVAENLYAGGNILYANTLRSIDDFGGLGTLNGFATYGNENSNITAAMGWGFAEGEFTAKPLITISGMARISKRIGFVSENWFIPEVGDGGSYYGILSYGIRFMGENLSVDLAFINNPDIAEALIIGVPFLDFVFNF